MSAKGLKYLELGVSVGKTFIQMAASLQDSTIAIIEVIRERREERRERRETKKKPKFSNQVNSWPHYF
jgi:hypothetical protein